MSAATQFCEDWLELLLDVWSRREQTNISEAGILERSNRQVQESFGKAGGDFLRTVCQGR
jgi:hypothetical protein